MGALRQSLQKPKRRAEQRDEEAIDNWKDKKWPYLKKGRASHAPDPWKVAHHMGRLTDPPGRAVKDFLAGGAASRVRLEQLPGCAPDLNPDEGVWKHLK